MSGLFVKNYGCQMNVYDTNKLLDLLSSYNYKETQSIKEAGLVILNTCHVREKAVTKLYSDLGRINIIKQSYNPNMLIAVIGCVAQIQGNDLIKRFPYVNFVLGTQAIQNLPQLINELKGKTSKKLHSVDTRFLTDEKFKILNINTYVHQKISAFVTIQEGCDNFCTYCSVPNSRGREYSRDFHLIIDEIKYLAEQGIKEIMLLGQNVNSYKFVSDAKTYYIEDIFSEIDKIGGIERIRYLSPNPQGMRDDLIESYRSIRKLMPFVHLPLQSGSNRILKMMNRPYTTDEYLKMVEKFRNVRSDMMFSTDLIVGFPSETNGDFEDTINMVNIMQYPNGFYFKYSPRPHTVAASMPNQIDDKIKNQRFQELHELMLKYKEKSNSSFIGQVVNVLFENHGKFLNHITGKSEYFQNVFVKNGNENDIGKIKKVRIKSFNASNLEGEIID